MLPEGADLAAARASLGEHLSLRAGRATSSITTFYDTFDGRLHAAGVTLHHAGGKLVLTAREDGAELAAAESTAAKRLFDRDLPDALRERLAPEIEMRALLPVARLRVQTLPVAVLNEDAKTVARLTLAASTTGAHGRVTASAVRGYERELDRVVAVLADTLALPEATVPLVDEAIVAAGGDPAGTSAKLNLALNPEDPANVAAATVFTRLVEVIRENVPGTFEDVDSEFLHDFRVAVRRTRSLQRQFKNIYPSERLEHFRTEFKRLQAETGDLRDMDVYLLDFDDLQASLPEKMRADLEPLRGVIETRRARALTSTRRALRAKRTTEALADWEQFVTSRRPADRTVKDLASHRITRVYRKMVKEGSAIDDDSPAEALHDLRKVGKELRYLLEFFASLYPPEVIKPFVKTLKGLQDQLGRFQDREVQANALRELAPALKDAPHTVMAMGVLVERFMQEEIAARAEFADRFEAFASKAQRDIVKEHFG
ncbi:CYTH and CHAD domain-containing protein [Solirubrobacter phytolaccae]|uniref:CYTH and CHAD domain-containing protein n=1 Tax=Solirubrobacter phytolaccae TaxID=1404360 RepID=UPI0022CE16F5|nr:CHAD domain-containing protein [Solirubrobacter phytolaccae]